MSVYDIIKNRRSIRRFKQQPVSYEILEKMIEAGRLGPSANNFQPIEYILVDDPKIVQKIFVHTRWAGYLPKGTGVPPAGQEPVAYIAILINKELGTKWSAHDIGAAAENIMLTGFEKGVGSCWLGAINREEIVKLLNITEHYELDTMIAVGYPDEEPVSEPLNDSHKYYKDESGKLHVPKRELQNILHHNSF